MSLVVSVPVVELESGIVIAFNRYFGGHDGFPKVDGQVDPARPWVTIGFVSLPDKKITDKDIRKAVTVARTWERASNEQLGRPDFLWSRDMFLNSQAYMVATGQTSYALAARIFTAEMARLLRAFVTAAIEVNMTFWGKRYADWGDLIRAVDRHDPKTEPRPPQHLITEGSADSEERLAKWRREQGEDLQVLWPAFRDVLAVFVKPKRAVEIAAEGAECIAEGRGAFPPGWGITRERVIAALRKRLSPKQRTAFVERSSVLEQAWKKKRAT